MGICSSEPKVDNVTKNINKQMQQQWQEFRKTYNILVTGTKYCGKSTFCKQIDHIRNKDTNSTLTHYEYELFNIRQDIVNAMIYLSDIINDKKNRDSLTSIDLEFCNQTELARIGNIILSMCKHNNINELLLSVQSRTNDINDNIQYYLNKIEDIFMNPNYVPSQQDIINSHMSIVGVSVHPYYATDSYHNVLIINDAAPLTYTGTLLNFLDISGRFWNDKKMYYFEGQTAVVFIASLSDYCVADKMKDSIDYFDYIVNCKWFRKSEIILCLSKNDLFKQRIKNGYSLSICFDEYNGPEYLQAKIGLIVSYILRKENYLDIIPIDIINVMISYSCVQCIINDVEVTNEEYLEHCYETSLLYIKEQYVSKFELKHNKIIFTHVATAIDSDVIEKILWDIKNITIRRGS